MALENLVRDLETKLKALGVKKEIAIQKGSPELLFTFDEVFQETLFTLESLRLKTYLLRISRSNNSLEDSREYKPLPLISHYQNLKNLWLLDFVKRIILTNKKAFLKI